jgi:alkylation response protein AidB-like acyl-CoA dehydrogenase
MNVLETLPPEDEALRQEVRAFLLERLAHLPLDQRARTWMGFDAAFSRDLAARGWVGLTLPKQYGGQARSYFARFVVSEELLSAGAPVAAHWIADRQSAPLILRFGTEDQKARYVPAICRGEAFFCIGMSEPNSGSDLASVRTRAVKVSGGWRLEGSKLWTSNGHRARYMIALARTSGSADDRSAGLSQFIVDLELSGVSRSPIRDLAGDAHFSEVHFDGVELGEDALVGQEGQGWTQVNAELAFERSGPERIYSSLLLLEAWAAFLRTRAAQEANERLLGRFLARLSALRAMSLGITGQLSRGEPVGAEAALLKDLGTTFEQSIPIAVGEALGADPDRQIPAELAGALIYLTAMSPSFSLRGGTREILRGIIARDLGLR